MRRASRRLQGGLRGHQGGLEKGSKGASRGLQALFTFVSASVPGEGLFKPMLGPSLRAISATTEGKEHPLKGTFEGGGSDPARPYRYIKSKKHKNRRQKQVSTFQIIPSVVKYDLHRLFAISQGEALGAGLRVGFKRGVQGEASREASRGASKGASRGGLRRLKVGA